jgi:glycine cleavage system H protein
MTEIIKEYRYTKDHEWVKRDEKDDHIVYIGITDYAQEALGDIVHVDIPDVGEEFMPEDELGAIESAKSASEIYAPLEGKIVEVNDELDSHPEIINKSPYDEGWIVKMSIEDPDQLDELLSSDGYEHYLEQEAH